MFFLKSFLYSLFPKIIFYDLQYNWYTIYEAARSKNTKKILLCSREKLVGKILWIEFGQKNEREKFFQFFCDLTAFKWWGTKKILFLKFKYPKELSEFIGSGDESNQTEERLPEKLRIELEIYIEKSLKGGFSPPRKKYLLTRIFQLCAGLTLQRNQRIKTKQLCLLYFLLYQ